MTPTPEKLVEHLSKEIETHTNWIEQFRSKINFALYVGPFFVLGSLIIALGKGVALSPARLNIAAIIIPLAGASVCYVLAGFACARVERHIWEQCNRWRSLILKLCADPTFIKSIVPDQLRFEQHLVPSYIAVYVLLLGAFISVCAFLIQLA